MPTPLVVLFYVWLAVSVVVLVRRLVGRGSRTKTPVVRATETTMTWPAPPDESRLPTELPAAPPLAPPIAPPPAPGAGERPARSLMEALSGISLPCDLLPLTTVEGRTLDEREVLLMTANHTPDEVVDAMGAELSRLGYQVTKLGGDITSATRGPDNIRMVVLRRPDTILIGTKPAYPTASSGDLIVELKL